MKTHDYTAINEKNLGLHWVEAAHTHLQGKHQFNIYVKRKLNNTIWSLS